MKTDISKYQPQSIKNLDERLSVSKYLAGENTQSQILQPFPWIARHDWHDIGLKDHKNLCRWYLEISERDAVIKGHDYLNKGRKIPKP